ncbi:MAG: hypothetical protein ACE5I1_19315 [bacterium]
MSKKCFIPFALILLLAATGWSQESKSAQAQRILEDAKLVDILVDRMVTNDNLRARLLAKLADFGKANPAKLSEFQAALSGKTEAAGPEILIKFKPGTKPEQIETMASQMGLQYVKSIPQLRLKVYKIAAGKNADEVMTNCQKHDFVEYAEKNQKYKTQSTQ